MIEFERLAPAERARLLLAEIIDPALAALRPLGIPSDDRARLLLVAIAGQESGIEARDQIDAPGRDILGPALGLWQCEGGLAGVAQAIEHPASARAARVIVAAAGVTLTRNAVWRALKTDDRLAAGIARLILWCERGALPSIEDEAGAWRYYLHAWKPGKPHPERWPGWWNQGRRAVAASPWGG